MRVRIDGRKGGLIESEAFWINFNRETQGPARIADDFMEALLRTTDVDRVRWKAYLSPGSRADAGTCAVTHAHADVGPDARTGTDARTRPGARAGPGARASSGTCTRTGAHAGTHAFSAAPCARRTDRTAARGAARSRTGRACGSPHA